MLEATPIPVLSDNYVWIVGVPGDSRIVAVDPGDAPPVVRALESSGRVVAGILVTHHHRDHTAGLQELRELFPGAPVWGPRGEAVAGVDRPVAGGDAIAVDGTGIRLEVLDVPGHTAGHVAYLGGGLVLTGDALFAGGCGRLFEGTPEDLAGSLGRLAALPPATRVCCAHEYTVANLEFAAAVEPSNGALAARLREARALRADGRPTLPSTIAEELATNPFLRVTEPGVVSAVERSAGRRLGSPVEVLGELRRWKDGWR